MKRIILAFFSLFVFLLFPFWASARNYDVYIDSSYSGDDSDGSQEKPFKKLDKAVEKAMDNSSGSRDIYVKDGEYEKAELGNSVNLFGQSKKAIIKGTLTLSGKNELNNITVSGGSPAVFIRKNADATIEDCEIKKFGAIGIQAGAGSGSVKIKNNDIYDGKSGKGVYIQEGKKIEIIGNDVYDNGQEGLDIRARVSGVIENNSIYGNGESGIEFIIGSSKLQIIGNKIKNNGASAIASQFYSGSKKDGKIEIKGNVLSRNKKYALDCALPSGGEPPSDYWANSIELLENTIEGNKIAPISDLCRIINVTDEEKEKGDNNISEVDLESSSDSENEELELKEEEMKKEEVIVESSGFAEEMKKTLDSISEKKNQRNFIFEEQLSKVNSRKAIVALFIGPDFSSLKIIKSEIEKAESDRAELFKLLREAKEKENKDIIREKIGEMSDVINAQKAIVVEKEHKVSFFGWIVRLKNKE